MDIILYNIGTVIFLLIFGYLVGSIPNAIWIGKVFFHKDPRDYGSGNAGGTNAGRVFGKRIGVLVIFLDAIKVIFCLYVAWLLTTKLPIYHGQSLVAPVEETYSGIENTHPITWPVYWITTISCSIGHCYPIFAQFRGGKNVSSYYGLLFGGSWAFGLAAAAMFFGVLKWKKYVSLGSLVFSWFGALISWIWSILLLTGVIGGSWAYFVSYGPSLDCNYIFSICLTLSAALLTFKHIENIKRIKSGTERKISWMK